MRVSAVATKISLKNSGVEGYITLVASPEGKVHNPGKETLIQIYCDKSISIEEKNALLYEEYRKIKGEIDNYGSCKLDLWLTKKSSNYEIIGYTGQQYQYTCSINDSPGGMPKIYMHEDSMRKTLDNYFKGIEDIRRQ